MDTQTTALTAIITSLVVLASPNPKPEAKITEAQAAISIIQESTETVDKKTRKLRQNSHERSAPAVLNVERSKR